MSDAATTDGLATLVYAGVDEAGYGPLLGPLCVGMCVLRVAGFDPGAGKTPDVWKSLRRVVKREPDAKSTRWIGVNDSKRLKLANNAKTHPLTHLERGVLCFARQLDRMRCDDDGALFESVGAALDGHPCYAGDAVALPLATTDDHLRLLATRLTGAMEAGGVELLDIRCATVCEGAFNERYRAAGTKSRVSFDEVGGLIRRVWKSDAAAGTPPARVVVDRQGGRRSYAGELERVLPGARVDVVDESVRASVYDVRGEVRGETRRMRVIFEVEAEQRHFPVALASMTAKLVRELAMMRFNRYWSGRLAELKPTAGYRNDAWRWIEDATRLGADAAELKGLCREA